MFVLSALAAACDRPPSVELKEWTPADHDGERKSASSALGAGGTGSAPKQGAKGDAGGTLRSPPREDAGTPAIVEVTWRNQCAACHGMTGKGDGPQGPMFKAADLGREDWQAKVKDEEIAATIQNGKGRMPKFDLPEEVVKGLVARIRTFRGR